MPDLDSGTSARVRDAVRRFVVAVARECEQLNLEEQAEYLDLGADCCRTAWVETEHKRAGLPDVQPEVTVRP